jgi:hypothetical protein
MLSDDQLRIYNEWAEKVAIAFGEADDCINQQIDIRFSFSPFGRLVEAYVPGSQIKLVLEEPF